MPSEALIKGKLWNRKKDIIKDVWSAADKARSDRNWPFFQATQKSIILHNFTGFLGFFFWLGAIVRSAYFQINFYYNLFTLK